MAKNYDIIFSSAAFTNLCKLQCIKYSNILCKSGTFEFANIKFHYQNYALHVLH